MKILAIRHGSVNRSLKEMPCLDPELNFQGISQMVRLAEILKDLTADGVIYSSITKRARNSAKILSDRLMYPIVYMPLLKDAGLPSEENLTDLMESRINWQKAWIGGWPGFEPVKAYKKRIRRAIQLIAELRIPKRPVLIIGHEEMVWTLISWTEKIHFSEAVETKIDYASVKEFNL